MDKQGHGKFEIKMPIKKLKKKLDAVFSLYIRLRDSDKNGIGRCITCKAYKYFTQADCGHYVKRQHMAVRFNEKNTMFQCKPCNGFEQGKDSIFRRELVKRYGEDQVLLLESAKRTTTKITPIQYEIMIAEYQEKIKKLMETKDFILSDHYMRLLK